MLAAIDAEKPVELAVPDSGPADRGYHIGTTLSHWHHPEEAENGVIHCDRIAALLPKNMVPLGMVWLRSGQRRTLWGISIIIDLTWPRSRVNPIVV